MQCHVGFEIDFVSQSAKMGLLGAASGVNGKPLRFSIERDHPGDRILGPSGWQSQYHYFETNDVVIDSEHIIVTLTAEIIRNIEDDQVIDIDLPDHGIQGRGAFANNLQQIRAVFRPLKRSLKPVSTDPFEPPTPQPRNFPGGEISLEAEHTTADREHMELSPRSISKPADERNYSVPMPPKKSDDQELIVEKEIAETSKTTRQKPYIHTPRRYNTRRRHYDDNINTVSWVRVGLALVMVLVVLTVIAIILFPEAWA